MFLYKPTNGSREMSVVNLQSQDSFLTKYILRIKMAAFKLIILLGIVGIALGFTIPEQEYSNPSNNYELAFNDELPLEDSELLVRKARSPQGRVGGSLGQDRFGSSGSLYYTHRLNKNYEIYGEAARHFGRNDNSAMLGIQYNF